MEDFLHNAWKTIIEYWFLIGAIASTVLMAIFRTAKKNGKVDWLEAGMCGILVYGIYFILGWFNLPVEASIIIGGSVGYLGTHRISVWVSDKFDIPKEDNKE